MAGIIDYSVDKFGTPYQQANPYLEHQPRIYDNTNGQPPPWLAGLQSPTTPTPSVNGGGNTNPFTGGTGGGNPYASIISGDSYPGETGLPTNPWGNAPGGGPYNIPGSNPFPGPLQSGPAVPGQPVITYGGGTQGSQGGNVIKEGETVFDPTKQFKIKGASGLEMYAPLPPKTYEEAGGYQQFIDAWKSFYENLRKALGLGDTWSQDDIDKLRPIFDQLGIKFQAKPGEKWSSRIYIPDGKGGYIQIDTRTGFVNYGHTEQSGGFGGGGTGTGTGGGTGGGGTGGTGTGGGSSQAGMSKQAQDLYDLLMKRATQSLDINRQDPIIRNQSDAFAAMQNRSRRDFLNAQAERSGPFANMTAERRSSAEKVGQTTSQFEAQLMGQELSARREEIAQALQLSTTFLTDQQRLALQRELGLIDAALRQLSISNQNNQFYDQFGFNVQQFAAQLDLIRRGLA